MTSRDRKDLGIAQEDARAAMSEDIGRERIKDYRTIFERAEVGIVRADRTGTLLDVNAAFARFIGYDPADLIGRRFVEFTHPEDAKIDMAFFTEMLQGSRDGFEREKRYLHKEGHAIWGRVNCSIVKDEKGRPSYAIAVIQDINERKTAEETLRQRTMDLWQLNLRLQEETKALETARYALEHRLSQIKAFNTMAAILVECVDRAEIARRTIDEVLALVGADVVGIHFVDESSGCLVLADSRGVPDGIIAR